MSKMSIDRAAFAKTRAPMARQSLNGSTMGTRYSAVFYAPTDTNVRKLESALFAAVDRTDRQMSTWMPDSDLNKLNAAPVGTWVDTPRELMAVLAAALQVEQASHGAFDISVGDIVSAWGFGPTRRRRGPDARAELREPRTPLVASIGYFPERYGDGIIRLALDLLSQKQAPPAVFTRHQLITALNVDHFYPNDSLLGPARPVGRA